MQDMAVLSDDTLQGMILGQSQVYFVVVVQGYLVLVEGVCYQIEANCILAPRREIAWAYTKTLISFGCSRVLGCDGYNPIMFYEWRLQNLFNMGVYYEIECMDVGYLCVFRVGQVALSRCFKVQSLISLCYRYMLQVSMAIFLAMHWYFD